MRGTTAQTLRTREQAVPPPIDLLAFYGPTDLAKLLRVKPQTVNQLVKRGDIPVAKVGTSWRSLGWWVLWGLTRRVRVREDDEVFLRLLQLPSGEMLTDVLRLSRPGTFRSPEEAAADAVRAVRSVRRRRPPKG